jgi:hypothetical protein
MRIHTNVLKKDILFMADYSSDPEDRAIYKYCCPICLQYYNHMLVSTCCKNYICRICIGTIAIKAKTDPTYVIHCTYCGIFEFKIVDVKEKDAIKRYTDSPLRDQEPKKLTKN